MKKVHDPVKCPSCPSGLPGRDWYTGKVPLFGGVYMVHRVKGTPFALSPTGV